MKKTIKRQEIPTVLPDGLYVVATPIGNLGDLSQRAREIFDASVAVFCEDTRVTAKLVKMSKLVRLDHHASASKIKVAVEQMESTPGIYALVSDAGTPGISDPGSPLVRAAREAGIEVFPVPGPSAVAAFLSVSGFLGEGFTFRGFFPKETAKSEVLLRNLHKMTKEMGDSAHLWVWFESPHRVVSTLERISLVIEGHARVNVAKELTKIHEKFFEGSPSEVLAKVALHVEREGPKGEWIVAIEVTPPDPADQQSLHENSALWSETLKALIENGISVSVATKAVSQTFGVPKNKVYQAALLIKS